jgi:hypothetical protein
MTPTLEEAYLKFKANETEAGQQLLIRLLNDEPGNDDAWKLLIDSYPDLDMQFQLANEYFNLTGGSQKASQTLLRFYKRKNEQFLIDETSDKRWLDKLNWIEIIPWFAHTKWSKALLVKIILGMAVLLLLTNVLWMAGSISASTRAGRLQLDFDRLAGVYSNQVLDYSTLNAQYSELQFQHSELQAAYERLEQAYKTLAAGITTP